MRKTIVAFGFFLFSTTHAQFKQGSFEVMFSGSAGTWGVARNEESRSPYYSGSSETSDSRFVYELSLAPAVYVLDGLSVQPEMQIQKIEERKASQMYLLNLSYTYLPPESRVAPFGRVGYGVSNSFNYPYWNKTLVRSSDALDVRVSSLGGGVKFVVSGGSALIVEYSRKTQTLVRETSYGEYYYKNKLTYSNSGILIGFSILL